MLAFSRPASRSPTTCARTAVASMATMQGQLPLPVREPASKRPGRGLVLPAVPMLPRPRASSRATSAAHRRRAAPARAPLLAPRRSSPWRRTPRRRVLGDGTRGSSLHHHPPSSHAWVVAVSTRGKAARDARTAALPAPLPPHAAPTARRSHRAAARTTQPLAPRSRRGHISSSWPHTACAAVHAQVDGMRGVHGQSGNYNRWPGLGPPRTTRANGTLGCDECTTETQGAARIEPSAKGAAAVEGGAAQVHRPKKKSTALCPRRPLWRPGVTPPRRAPTAAGQLG